MSKISRREALLRLAALGFAFTPPALLSSCSSLRTKAGRKLNGLSETPFDRLSPVNRFLDHLPAFSGDNSDRLRSSLQKKTELLKHRHPIARERQRIVIVGGGMSGILTAYLLRDLKPVLLDQNERFGGNSRGESWEGVDYSIGASCLSYPEKNSPLEALYHKAGVLELCRPFAESDPVLLGKKLYSDFWKGDTDPQAARQFTRVRDFFLTSTGNRRQPLIPVENEDDLSRINQLDRSDLLAYLTKELGEPLHPHVHATLELYCWSALGGSMQELSAAIGVSSCAREFSRKLVAPAGNSSIAERYLKLFLQELPLATHARPSCVVLDVKPQEQTVEVTYLDRHGEMRLIEADTVVMACPKFVAGKLIKELEQDRGESLKQLEYRAYLVANACLNSPATRDLHNLYLLKEGEIPFGSTMRNQHNHGSTNVNFANFAQVAKDKTVLTVYHPLPFPEGRAELQLPNAYQNYSELLRQELLSQILPELGYSRGDLKELRLTRWERPIPVARPGFYFSGTPQALSKPLLGRIFFVNQDNWAAPSIESCALEALRWAPKIREILS